MNIFFICKHNIFRSKIAEAYFKKINKDLKINVDSGGIIIGRPVNKNQSRAAKLQRQIAKTEFQIIPKGNPKSLTTELLKKQDLIIIVADDVPKIIFNNKGYVRNLVQWKIPDSVHPEPEKIRRTIKMIVKKVDGLADQFNQ